MSAPEPARDAAPPGDPAAPEAAPAPDAAPAPAAGPAPAPADEPAALQRELAELRERNLRLLAEVQNAQKRAQREKQEALRYAEAELARDLLVIIDDLERTLDAARSAGDAPAVVDGVRIVYEHFLKVLRQRHIEPIEAVGRPFNPALHEALLQRPSDEHPAGTVVEELARGYRMHERVLRPSRVVVSAGPAAAPAPAGPPPKEE